MCFYSLYVDFWYFYIFFKLLLISKEINFCFYVFCKIGFLFGCGGELRREAFLVRVI